MSFQVGQSIGDYQIIGILGAGGMGQVYKVRNVISDRIEAMKVLLPNLASEPELADRFMREIKVLASLSHPNIAGLHTALRVENQLLMIMELVEGVTLEARLKQGPIPVADSLNYISQVAAALAYAHEQGVIHRDIKPANMMLTQNGVVKLMDFGIAKSSTDQRMTLTGTTMGSLYYMSPEQVKGIPLDARSDLYSLGVSLYELVTGRKPFQGDSNYAIMAAHLQMAPPPPIEADPSLPKPLNDLILTCLAKDPAQRFGSARALANALEHVKATLGQPAPATPTPAVAAGASTRLATQALAAQQRTTQAPAGGLRPPTTTTPAPNPVRDIPLAPATRGSHSLYMVLGAFIVVAVLVIAALELPHYFKTRAGASSTTSPAQPAPSPSESGPAATPGNVSQTPVTPTVTLPSESPGMGANSPSPRESATSGGAAAAARPLSGSLISRPPATAHRRTGIPVQTGVLSPSLSGTESRPEAAAEATAARVAPTKPSAEALQGSTGGNAGTIEHLSDRMALLSARANAVKNSLDDLRRQQEAQGTSLRLDIAAALSLMEQYMDAADRALSKGNAALAEKNMDLAERQVQALEKFLGK
jgi:serine/threonine protein kinase